MRDETAFDLGVVGEEQPPAPAGTGRAAGRWVWPVVALAFVLGAVLALVVANARDDAAAYADIRLVSGMVQAMSGQAEAASPGNVEVALLNLGEHEVEILGLVPAGMTVREGHEPEDPVTAPPGQWVTAGQTGLIADCTITDPGDGVQVRVRDGAGTERLVDVRGMPSIVGWMGAWAAFCPSQGLQFGLTDATAVTHDGESLTMDLAVANSGAHPLQVTQFDPDTQGMAAPAPEVPFDVPAGASVAVPLTWTVTDCEAALRWPDVHIVYDINAGDDGQTGGHYPVFGRARAELVLLVQRVCGDGE